MDPESSPEGEQESILRPDTEARKKEIERIAADIEEVKRQMELERKHFPVAEDAAAADLPSREAWEALSREEQAEWIRNVRRCMEENPEEFAEIPGLETLLERLERISAHRDALIRMEDEALEISLQSHADQADAATRLIVSMAEIMTSMEKFTENDWQDIPPGNRGEMMDLLNAWRNGQREACLSQLPIGIRRRYE